MLVIVLNHTKQLLMKAIYMHSLMSIRKAFEQESLSILVLQISINVLFIIIHHENTSI